MMNSSQVDPNVTVILCLLASIPLTYYFYRRHLGGNNGVNDDCWPIGTKVPNAVGGLPIMGNALQYQKNPTGCIREQEASTRSKVFRMNLAGRKIIIVGSDASAMKQVATKPASVLSSRKAVAEIGFEYTLGPINVYKGTDWHKQILKDYIMGDNFQSTFLPGIFKALSNAIDEEVKLATKRNGDLAEIPDLFHFIRRVVLRATLDNFVSPLMLHEDPGLLEALMVFQDKVEDATAKAAVLPRIIALPVCLWSTQKAREALKLRISKILPDILRTGETVLGPWLQTYSKEKTPPEDAAEHLIGLIFAAHKNPAIGAAQCICFLRTETNTIQQEQLMKESKDIFSEFSSSTANVASLVKAKLLRASVLETLRLTAHTIGALRYAEESVEINMSATGSPRSNTIVIPKGETVGIAHHSMHMERSMWGANAEKFSLTRPEWESDDKTDIGIPVDHYKFTSFSNGVHKCPGERIALAMMEMLVAILLVKKVEISGKLAPISFERATLAQRDGLVRAVITAKA